MSELRGDLIERFTYHEPKGSQSTRYHEIRNNAYRYAGLILDLTPKSREQSLAITKLEEVVFWANAAIARRENRTPTKDSSS